MDQSDMFASFSADHFWQELRSGTLSFWISKMRPRCDTGCLHVELQNSNSNAQTPMAWHNLALVETGLVRNLLVVARHLTKV
ncbi:MAG TPA: hypothetical protein VFB76_19615 [Candidatus Angelobacter sp.]|nr:hypothetical protein [Candidatus Angelobacter sp.]